MQLHQEFIKTAKKLPNKLAIIDEATEKKYSYQQLLIATIILSRKLPKDEHSIGILLPNSAGCMISILATQMAGKIPVMINFSTGATNNCLMAQQKCQFKQIITCKPLVEKLKMELVDGMIFIEDIVASITLKDKISGFFISKIPDQFTHKGGLDDTAIILFTSGSEKTPKAVQLTHRNIKSNVKSNSLAFNFSSVDIFMSILPLFHVFGLTTSFYIPLSFGCTIVTHPSPLDFLGIVRSIKKNKGSILCATPTFFYGYLLKSKKDDFKSVKLFVSGGDKLGEDVREGYQRKHNLQIYEGYGATETSPVISTNCPGYNKNGSIGRPNNGVEVKILHVETFKQLGPNQEGKILVRGDLVMKGYLNDEQSTHKVIDSNGWYDTGDIGKIDNDGYLWHCGRLRRFVKIGGEMISLVRVEDKLKESLQQESMCCVVEVPHPLKGFEIVAAVTEEINQKEVITALSKDIPRLAIPKKFHYMKELPVMGNGKVDFRTITNQLQSQYH